MVFYSRVLVLLRNCFDRTEKPHLESHLPCFLKSDVGDGVLQVPAVRCGQTSNDDDDLETDGRRSADMASLQPGERPVKLDTSVCLLLDRASVDSFLSSRTTRVAIRDLADRCSTMSSILRYMYRLA